LDQNLKTINKLEGILGLLDMFSGGAFSNASIFALELCHISASVVQLIYYILIFKDTT
jgi:preprotein translocase subunit SecY